MFITCLVVLAWPCYQNISASLHLTLFIETAHEYEQGLKEKPSLNIKFHFVQFIEFEFIEKVLEQLYFFARSCGGKPLSEEVALYVPHVVYFFFWTELFS